MTGESRKAAHASLSQGLVYKALVNEELNKDLLQ